MYLPSLKNIEAFIAAAEKLNFTKAGKELHLTSAAISQRIIALEDTLGMELFTRNGPKLELTDQGQSCLPVFRRVLQQIRDSVGELQDMTQTRILNIKTSPSFAQKWLIPRLGRFKETHSDIDLRIESTTNRVSIKDDELTLAIYYGIDPKESLPGNLGVDTLFKEQVFPVCSPDFAEHYNPINSLTDLKRLPLIHDDTMNVMRIFPNWRRWCDYFDVKGVNSNNGLRYVISGLAVDAAIEGLGMALARGALVRDEMERSRLIRPFEQAYPVNFEYRFIYPKVLSQRDDFIVFRNWLLEEAKEHKETYPL